PSRPSPIHSRSPSSARCSACRWTTTRPSGAGRPRSPAASIGLPSDQAIVERGRKSRRALADYFRRLVPERRQRPQDDLLSGLLAAEEQGDKLTQDEVIAMCLLLFIAGHETTVNLIGNGTLALLRHPDQMR